MNERDALYRHICENPDDDTARFVFADWLQEHGEEHRAEFIRIQCRLASMAPNEPEWVDLRIREEQLLTLYRSRWVDELPHLAPETVGYGSVIEGRYDIAFERGFPLWTTTPLLRSQPVASILGERLRGLFEQTPIRCIELHDEGPVPQELIVEQLAVAELAELRGLLVTAYVRGEARASFGVARSPTLTGLRRLGISYPNSVAGLVSLAGAPLLTGLRELDLSLEARTGQAFSQFLSESDLSNLAVLRLRGEAYTDTVQRVYEAQSLRPHTLEIDRTSFEDPETFDRVPMRFTSRSWELARLSLQNVVITRDWLRSLPQLPRLASLRITNALLWPDDPTLLSGFDGFENLRDLDLSLNSIGDGGWSRLAASRHLRNLRRLTLDGTGVTQDGLRDILLSPHLAELRWLSLRQLNRPSIPGRTVAEILKSMDFPNLRHLDLSRMPLGTQGAIELSKLPCLKNLRSLRLAYCRIGDNGAKALFSSPTLSQVEFLDLTGNAIAGGAEALTEVGVLPSLVRCELANNRLSSRLTQRLRTDPRVQL